MKELLLASLALVLSACTTHSYHSDVVGEYRQFEPIQQVRNEDRIESLAITGASYYETGLLVKSEYAFTSKEYEYELIQNSTTRVYYPWPLLGALAVDAALGAPVMTLSMLVAFSDDMREITGGWKSWDDDTEENFTSYTGNERSLTATPQRYDVNYRAKVSSYKNNELMRETSISDYHFDFVEDRGHYVNLRRILELNPQKPDYVEVELTATSYDKSSESKIYTLGKAGINNNILAGSQVWESVVVQKNHYLAQLKQAMVDKNYNMVANYLSELERLGNKGLKLPDAFYYFYAKNESDRGNKGSASHYAKLYLKLTKKGKFVSQARALVRN